MRWPWRRTEDETEAALVEDRRRLAEVRGQWGQVREATARLTEHRRKNHFAESIATVYRSRP